MNKEVRSSTIVQRSNRLLIIAFNYPPSTNVGSIRPAKFAKYLPDYGFQPIVLTNRLSFKEHDVEIGNTGETIYRAFYPVVSLSKQPALVSFENIRDLKNEKLQPHRIKTLLHNSIKTSLRSMYQTSSVWLDFPDAAIRWYPFAVQKGSSILGAQTFDAIYSTSGPATAHIVASTLAKRFNVPWIADYRDPWCGNPYRSKRPLKILQSAELFLERQTLKTARFVTTTSETYAKILHQILNIEPILIRNGFDEADTPKNVPLLPTFTITYTGEINDLKVRNPEALFQAIHNLLLKAELSRQEICVRFFGNSCHLVRPLAEKYGISDLVEISGRITADKVLIRQSESSVLLILDTGESGIQGGIGVKTYEYLAASRPILAIVPPGGDIASLIYETGFGVVANSPNEIAQLLVRWRNEFYNKKLDDFSSNQEKLRPYTRRIQAEQLASLLTKIIS